MFKSKFFRLDWILFISVLLITSAGLFTMGSVVELDSYFIRQLVLILISIGVFWICSLIDWHFLKRSNIILILYFISIAILLALFIVGDIAKGAQRGIDLGLFSVQPTDLVKLVLIILLAKYFTRRHTEIARFRHIIISGLYAVIPFFLIALQPDFGSALAIFFIWLGMILVSGVPVKYLLMIFGGGAILGVILWNFSIAGFQLEDYQKARIMNFLHPLEDVQGAGYNAYQAVIAVGSGGLLGKGIGYGTQSRLRFLPEYQTDFIFAAFAEQWGFVGIVLLLLCFGVLLGRLFTYSIRGQTNFETFFCIGVIWWFMAHLIINIGMNIGLMPITGIPLPLMSYGGSHLLIECAALGMAMSMSKYHKVLKQGTYDKYDNQGGFLS